MTTIAKAVLLVALSCLPIETLAQQDPASRLRAQVGDALNKNAQTTEESKSAYPDKRNEKAKLSSMPCSKLLTAYGSPERPAPLDTLVDFVVEQGEGLGSAANILDYVATECRLNEKITIGQAVKNLFIQEREHRLPVIPMGGATNDPKVQADWKAFERWVHHQGPRPNLADEASAKSPQPEHSSSVTPLEERALIDSVMKGQFDSIDALVVLVRANSYKCDSISSVQAWVLSRGFTLVCNRFAYEYEIADKGGRWTVTVK